MTFNVFFNVNTENVKAIQIDFCIYFLTHMQYVAMVIVTAKTIVRSSIDDVDQNSVTE